MRFVEIFSPKENIFTCDNHKENLKY